ncbi:hypothetical protein Lbys_2239 [Leadbetterella byssophila DSM 17132]|jgi:hypothetical protein|uniref:IS66 family insertion sequence element accessory protein TnpB n=2 Tax=Leadbetterella byssophila (strain DSM 17132 / JCM 16389 / KACC 11308 / NBRC 106382 / 4M15) TaxID=649349 RepID=E4RV38_LEAB4|nr:hypothetical protein Lbys_2239 [Leadbetterella byssophila DSM 17132]
MSKEEKKLQMSAMLADWHQSGKSKKRYCEENGISTATFYYWFSRSKVHAPGTRSFLSIDKMCKKGEVEVIYPNGVRIKVDADLGLLSQLIHLY